jgi:DNA-binding GntR family transcriptional regulator
MLTTGPFKDLDQSAGTAEDEAYLHVLSAIRTGRFPGGERLIPEDIATTIGMSRMPVREALKRLASEGLVQIRPNRGCVVVRLTSDEIFEVFEMRSVLEGLATRLAVPRLGDRALGEVDRLFERLERAESDVDSWIATHRTFHEFICSYSGRDRLMKQIRSLHVIIEPYLRLWFHHSEKPIAAHEEHRAIVDIVKSGDALEAERIIEEHILTTAPLLIPYSMDATDGAPRT